MREFTKAAFSFPWAMSLFGVEQLTNILIPQNSRTVATAFDAVTQATGEQWSETVQSLYLLGDNVQREMTDLLISLLTPEVFNPRSKATAATIQQSAEICRSLNPGQGGSLTLQELWNKLRVFFLVRDVRNRLQLPSEPPFPPLLEAVEKAYALEPYAALWAVEGLGHWYGDSFFVRHEVPRDILTNEHVSALPDNSLAMLHAGIGLAFAQHWLKTVNHLSPIDDIRHVLEQIITLCRENAQPGYEGAALESLGLISQNGQFYGETRPDEMVQIVSQQLEYMAPEVFDYFWHGVGRAQYFLPIQFIPGYGSIWHAVGMIRNAVPNNLGWLNAIAGLAWAVTMVNIRQPQIVANLLQYHGNQLSADDGFANGVASSLMVRYDTTPDAPFIAPFYHYQPAPGDPGLAQFWHSQVSLPATKALQDYYPVLKQYDRLGEIFHYQSLPELGSQLGKEAA